jgi:hypothetical protein
LFERFFCSVAVLAQATLQTSLARRVLITHTGMSSTPPVPTGPQGSWTKAAPAPPPAPPPCDRSRSPTAVVTTATSSKGKGRCNPWQTTAIGIAWSKGWDQGFAKGSKGKGGAYGGWANAAAPVSPRATAAKASSAAAPVVPNLLDALTNIERILQQQAVIIMMAERIEELERR